MLTLKQQGAFKKDLKRVDKRDKDLAKLHRIVDSLQAGVPLHTRHRVHLLSGKWAHHWECHIEPDWLLIYQLEGDDMLVLVRTGTHADLFG